MECYIEPITALTARLETNPNFYWSNTIGFWGFCVLAAQLRD